MTTNDEILSQLPSRVAATLRDIIKRYPIRAVLSTLVDVVEETSAPPETGATSEEEQRYLVASQLRDVISELANGGNEFTYDMGYSQAVNDMVRLDRPRFDLAAIERGEHNAPYFQGYLTAYKRRDGR